MVGWRKLAFLLTIFSFFLLSVVVEAQEKKKRVVYPRETRLDLKGIDIEGRVKSPGEFYFKHRFGTQFNSLLDRRKNFHKEMVRDSVLIR